MISPAHRFQWRPYLLDLAALALIVFAPFVVLLSYHGYPYFTPEVLLILAAALAAAALLALLISYTTGFVRVLVLAGLIALFIDMHVGLSPRWSSLAVMLMFLGVVAVLAALLWLLRENAATIVCVIFITLLALTLVRGSSPSLQVVTERTATTGGSSAEPPLLIHLLLDEHIGVESLPPEIPGTSALRQELVDFYTSRGFRLFGGAYSEYAHTYNSIANLLNFSSREVSHPYLSHGTDETEWQLKQAAYFPTLRERGYRLHVIQSTYMDLCHAEGAQVQECITYPVTGLRLLRGLKLQTTEKVRAFVSAIVTKSSVLRVANKVYERGIRGTLLRVGWHVPAWRWQGPLLGPLQVPTMFERLGDDIVRHPRGHAFFAHLVLPHYPYAFDRRCELRPHAADWGTNRIASTDPLVYNTKESRAQKYELYADQVRCVLKLLDGLFGDLERRGLLDDATIIVQGDHGSRIPLHFPTGATLANGVLTDADFSDTFSTLYAIRAPGVSPGYDAAPLSVVELLNQHLEGEPSGEPGHCRVFLLDEGGGSLTGVEPKFCAP